MYVCMYVCVFIMGCLQLVSKHLYLRVLLIGVVLARESLICTLHLS